MAALTKELREYLHMISPYEGHLNYLKRRFKNLSFSEALRESRLIQELDKQSMIKPSCKTTIHTWDIDNRSNKDHSEEALAKGVRCIDVPDWFVLSLEGLNYARTRRKRNLKWIITAVLAPFVLWLITVLFPIIVNVVAMWWFSFA